MDYDELHTPEEPEHLKLKITRLHPEDTVEGMDIESFSVWYGNEIQSYLWKAWKPKLEPIGWNWQKFLKLMSFCTDSFTTWVFERRQWSDVIEDVKGRFDDIGDLILHSS